MCVNMDYSLNKNTLPLNIGLNFQSCKQILNITVPTEHDRLYWIVYSLWAIKAKSDIPVSVSFKRPENLYLQEENNNFINLIWIFLHDYTDFSWIPASQLVNNDWTSVENTLNKKTIY